MNRMVKGLIKITFKRNTIDYYKQIWVLVPNGSKCKNNATLGNTSAHKK
jgi:hypothetical protein